MKMTNQRLQILNFLKGNKGHPSVEEIYLGVKEKLPRISKATVYQNIKFLAEKSYLKEINIRGVLRVEPDLSVHHHAVCTMCEGIWDIDSRKTKDSSKKEKNNIKGFEVDEIDIIFRGRCSDCMAKDVS